MPAAHPIDREQVRIVAAAVGVREAARQFGLAEGTVQYWSASEGWMRKEQEVAAVQEAAMERKIEASGLQPRSTMSAAEVLKGYDGDTRFHLAKGLNAGAKEVGAMDGQEVLMASQNIASLVKSAAVVHGWAGGDNTVNVRLDVLAGQTQASPVIDIE